MEINPKEKQPSKNNISMNLSQDQDGGGSIASVVKRGGGG